MLRNAEGPSTFPKPGTISQLSHWRDRIPNMHNLKEWRFHLTHIFTRLLPLKQKHHEMAGRAQLLSSWCLRSRVGQEHKREKGQGPVSDPNDTPQQPTHTQKCN